MYLLWGHRFVIAWGGGQRTTLWTWLSATLVPGVKFIPVFFFWFTTSSQAMTRRLLSYGCSASLGPISGSLFLPGSLYLPVDWGFSLSSLVLYILLSLLLVSCCLTSCPMCAPLLALHSRVLFPGLGFSCLFSACQPHLSSLLPV